MIYGYARVSSEGQSLDSQLDQLKAADCAKIYQEKISAASVRRAELAKLLQRLADGDVVIVCRLDRLARSSRDLLNILHEVTTKKASLRSIGDPWADTTTAHGKLMVTVLGGLAEFERTLIRTRTSEGRSRAQKDGVKFGRRRKLTPHQQREVLARRRDGESLKSIARSYNVSHCTISRIANRR